MIPDLETSDVELKGPPAKVQRDPFHQQLVLREGRVAGVARFAVAWTTPNPSDAVMRQVPVLELAPDEKTERFLVQELTVRAAIPVALELPRREAADVDMELVQSRVAPSWANWISNSN